MTLILLITVLLLYIFANIYVSIRSKSFTSRYRFFRIFIVAGHLILLLAFAGIILFSGKPHHDYRSFSLYFQLTFALLWVMIPVFMLFILYLPADFLHLLIHKKVRQGTCIMIRRIFHKTAIILTFIFFSLMFYGYFWGVTDFNVREYTITSEKIPDSFNGTRILHFSDTHLGSFFRISSVEKGIALMKEQHPDIILFTGDLVNISAKEALPYMDMFSSLEAPLGKYAILGNHDLSDYMKMDIRRDSMNVNTPEVVLMLEKMGFIVLRDTCVYISNGTDSIQLAGTDSWGKPPFRQWGNPQKALKNAETSKYTILMTHDPSAWDYISGNDLHADLTLSGHTHGMQLGIRWRFIDWSPIKIKYPNWAGLYFNKEKALHVNPGFGFIGLPFRIGVRPEITVITLRN
jgi:uncharacterized protein